MPVNTKDNDPDTYRINRPVEQWRDLPPLVRDYMTDHASEQEIKKVDDYLRLASGLNNKIE